MIRSITLTNFRNFTKKEVAFSPNITILVGSNAVGKTNILESLFILATGKSFKARVEEEMINYEKDVARISGKITKQVASNQQLGVTDSEEKENESNNYSPLTTNLEIVLTDGEIKIGDVVQKAPKKKLLVNGVPRRLLDFVGNFVCVLFAPSDLDLVTESPSVRRKFMDNVLSQTNREYRRSLLSYDKGLRQRNKILWKIREEGTSRSQLLFWNHLLVKNGDYISKKREEFISFINEQVPLSENEYQLSYDKSAISEARFEQYKNEEIAAATTLVGPHRDDFIFMVKGEGQEVKERELSIYGSRGEQRMGVLWLKLAELTYVTREKGEKPTLLLDDIFSELDHMHRDVVMQVINETQTIMTTADPHYVEGVKGAAIIEL